MTDTEAAIKATIEQYEEDFDEEEFEELPVISSHQNLQLAMTMKAELTQELFGQEQAIETVADSIKTASGIKKAPRRPTFSWALRPPAKPIWPNS